MTKTTSTASPTTTTTHERRTKWRSRLIVALRTVLACSIVGSITLYGPDIITRQLAFPAYSYTTVILIVTDATLGDAMRGCYHALCATVQGALPGLLSLWVIGPARLTESTTALAVALSAFVVALPESTHLICKRIAMGQIVLLYVMAFVQGAETDVFMHPLRVAASTAVGAVAAVLALLFPYPRLACCKVKKKCNLFAENASERLSLFVLALCSQDKTSALASLSQAQLLSKTGSKLLQSIKLKQVIKPLEGSMQWEKPWNRFLQSHHNNPGERVQSLETPMRGMEIAINCCPSFPVRVVDSELKSLLQRLEEHISLTLRHVKCSLPSDCSSTVPETNREEVYKSFHTFKAIFPTYEDLPSFFFIFCMKILYHESVMTQLNNLATNTKEQTNSHKHDCLSRLMGLFSNERLVFALKCSLSLGLAVLFGLNFNKEDSIWSGLTVGLGIASTGEATFKVANLRAQGTVLGSIYGVFGCFLLQRFMTIRFLSLLPWIIFTSFLRHSKMYGQAGGMAAIIAALLILGRKNYGPSNEFAFARIMESFIGLFCYILVEILLQPTRAATLAKIQLSQTIGTLYECSESISLNSIEKLKENKQEELRIQVSKLGKIIAEAEGEPNFWFLPFHGACYSKLLGSLTKMMELLVLGAHAISLLRESHGLGVAWKDLLEQIDGDLELFKKMICSSVDCCEAITSMKSLETLEKELRMKNICCDIELGKSPSPDQFKLLSANDDEMEMFLSSFLQNSKQFTDKIHAGEGELKSQVVLCLSALGFCMEGLMKETREIAMGVKELVQWENPSCHVNLYEIYCKIQSKEFVGR
ncbi:hypothetical protein NE237_003766 [Protea cynaroides]|uniref:Integral membrane bound transporter domain-containing protein n=1 Tax=Protea cynaroides TaxID=273540 RepID=A0A9Q0KHM1_9MAGN|nr:hypothetical protein NE237_003766 [Protea cynaroides]